MNEPEMLQAIEDNLGPGYSLVTMDPRNFSKDRLVVAQAQVCGVWCLMCVGCWVCYVLIGARRIREWCGEGGLRYSSSAGGGGTDERGEVGKRVTCVTTILADAAWRGPHMCSLLPSWGVVWCGVV